MTVLIIVSVHILIVALSYLLMRLHVFNIDKQMIVIIACIPVWGLVSALIVSFLVRTNRVGRNSKDLEVMHNNIEAGETIIVEAPESANVVPLQDALLMDDSATKRSVMLDVLMSDARDYLPVLNEARMNDDVEVVHYATTAMVELSKEYELRLQEYSTEYALDPEKEGLLDKYISFLEQYVSSNMIQGQILEIQKNTLQQLLMEKVNRDPSPEAFEKLILALLSSGQLSIADEAINRMEEMFPDDDRTFKLRFRHSYMTGAGTRIREMVKKVGEGDRYYSKEIRDMVSLWDDGKKESSA
jgi:hypothetical protein